MKTHKLVCVALATLALTLIIGCAPPRQAARPAISQTAVTVQRHDAESNQGGTIAIEIDDKIQIQALKDMETGSAIVNNGVHVIKAKCPKGESAMLNFTANSKTIAFLTAYKSGGFFSKAECRLERMNVDDDTGYMTSEKMQQSYTDQSKFKSQPAYDPYAEIEKLAELRKKGIITEEEFQQKKKDILSR